MNFLQALSIKIKVFCQKLKLKQKEYPAHSPDTFKGYISTGYIILV